MKSSLRLAASTAIIALMAAPAHAQIADEPFEDEIFVTATKRTTTLQDTPVAVTVTDFETIERAEINDVLDLQSVVPSLRVDQLQASTQTNFIIRGFGNGANNPGIEPSVGVFVDGVYRSRSAASIGNLPNLERVEVLAGPQSTLFGKNASAGVISVVTQAPRFDQEGYVEAGIGNFDLFQAKAYITGPLSDTVAYSLGGGFQNRDGYFARSQGGDRLNDRNRFDIRGQLLFEPSDDLSIRLIADYNEIDELCCGTATFVASDVSLLLTSIGQTQIQGNFNDPFARVAFTDITPENSLEDYGLSAQIDYDFGNDLSLTSITAYRENRSFSNIDADFTTLDLLDENIRDDALNTFTQELRLASNYDGPINFQVGGFYFNESVDSFNTIAYGSDLRAYLGTLAGGAFDLIEAANPDIAAGEIFGDQVDINEFFTQDDETFSLFGTVDFEVNDRITLTGGLNYTDVSKEVTGRSVNNDTFSNLDLFGPAGANAIGLNVFLSGQAPIPGLLPDGIPAFQTAFGLAPTPENFFLLASGGAGAAAQQGFLAYQAGVNQFATAVAASPNNPFAALTAFQFQPQFLAFPNAVESGVVNNDDLSWSIRGNFEASDAVSIYGAIATGFKAASFNLSRDSRPFQTDASALQAAGLLPNNYIPATGRNFGTRFAEPEESIVYEIGAKTRFSLGTFNIALFSQRLENFQTNAFVGSQFVLANAGETRVNGAEITGRLNLTDGFFVDYAGTFLDAEYTDFTNASGPAGGIVDLTGTEPDNIADVSLSIGATYEHDFGNGMEGFIRGDYQYEAPTVIATNLQLPGLAAAAASRGGLGTTLGVFEGYDERSQNIVNVSAGIGFETGTSVQIWGRNVFGDDFVTTLFPGVAQFGIVNGYPSPPPTYGINIRQEF